MKNSTIYNIVSFSEKTAVVHFDASSEILGAHFPERAIVPGSCLIEMARELVGKILDKPLIIKEIKSVKFVSVIEPSLTPEVIFDFENDCDGLLWRVTVRDGQKSFAKMKIEFSYEQ